MTIDEAKRLFDYVADIYQSGKMTGAEFTLLFNSQQSSYYEFLLGKVEQFQYGRPVPRVGIGMSNNITTRLSPFIKSITGQSPVAGALVKPSNFGRLVSMYETNSGRYIELVDHSKMNSIKNSKILYALPYCVENSGNFLVGRVNDTVDMTYYPSKPDNVNWGSTSSGAYNEVNDPSTSVNPLWMDMDVVKIIARMLKVHGISVDDQALVQYGQGVTNTGE